MVDAMMDDGGAVEKVKGLTEASVPLLVSAPTIFELYAGIGLRLATMQSSGPNRTELGSLAIDLMIQRVKAEQIINGDFPEDAKKTAKETIAQIDELEKRLVRLFMFSKLASGQPHERFPAYAPKGRRFIEAATH